MRAIISTRLYTRGLLLSVILILGLIWSAGGCSTPKSQPFDPFAAADERKGVDLLDDRDQRERREGDSFGTQGSGASNNNERYRLPLPPAEMSREIDGEADDWDRRDLRSFEGRKYIISGEEYWSGSADAGFKVAIDADEGYLYFLVEVRDDKVIDAESREIMSDGVVIWLRDPALADLLDALPAEMAEARQIRAEVGILFTPDGQFWRVDDGEGDLHREGIEAATVRTKDGYRVEVALSIGVLGQVAALPLERVAFRVELMDGDEASRRGEQTRMSMLPDESGPRFALYDMQGLLPFVPAYGHPPRPGGLGRWMRSHDAWHFESFEVMPRFWRSFEDTNAFSQSLNEAKVFDEICPLATHERNLVEAYQSTRATHRAGLLLCGPRAPSGRCPRDAATNLYWVHLTRDGDDWALAQHTQVNGQPLNQCATAPRPDGDLHQDFSLLPFEMLGGHVWGVGWTRSESAHQQKRVEKGVWFFNPRLEQPFMGTAMTGRFDATGHERTLSDSRVFLAEVDEVKGLDICEIEHVRVQQCASFNKSCHTGEHGETRQVHVQLWEPNKQRFEPYIQTKHRGCSAASFDFSTRPGYMLLHDGKRLGTVASPAN